MKISRLVLKIARWSMNKLIAKGKAIDLNKNDKNDLQEWVDYINKYLQQDK